MQQHTALEQRKSCLPVGTALDQFDFLIKPDGREQIGQEQEVRLETMRISSSSSAHLMEIISSSSGNGRNGVVGIPLRLLLKVNKRSVADFCPIAKASPKSFKSQLYIGVYTLLAYP